MAGIEHAVAWLTDPGPIGAFLLLALGAHLLLGSGLVLCVALALRMRARSNAATRHDVWMATLLLLSLLPLGLFVSPWPEGASPASQETEAAGRGNSTPTSLGAAKPASHGATAARDVRPPRRTPWAATGLVLGAGCVAVTLLALLRLGLAWQGARRLRRRAQADPRFTAMARALAERLDLPSRPRVYRHPELSSPACVGVLRPWIALPLATRGDTNPETHALLHELAHVHRLDPLLGLVQRALSGLLAWHPAARWVSRQIDLERECACDDWAITHSGATALEYGESLLHFATPAPEPHALRTTFRPAPGQLRRRILHMTDPARPHDTKRSSAVRTLAPLTVLAALLATAPVWPGLPAAATPAPPPAAASDDVPRMSADDAPLYAAIRSGRVELVRGLLENGESADQRWPGDGSPLIVAARRGDLEIARTLLELGASVDLGVDGDGNPLVQAAGHGNLKMAELLVGYGADVDFAAAGGDGTPLIEASKAGELEMARWLIARGADVNLYKEDDDTPLINAAQQGHLDMIELLLAEGADPNGEGDYDRRLDVQRTPLNQAEKAGHRGAAARLRAAGANR